MHSLSRRRSIALIAAAATLGSGALTTAAQASAATSDAPASSYGASTRSGILDPVLALLLGLLPADATVAQVQSTVNGLTSGQIGSLLGAAPAAGKFDALLGGLTAGQLTGAVGSLLSTGELGTLLDTLTDSQLANLLAPLSGSTLGNALALLDVAHLQTIVDGLAPAQLAGALAPLNASQLTSIVGVLSPARLTTLLTSPGAATSVVTGLAGKATSLAGGAPSAGQVNGLLSQVQALLGGGLPTVPGTAGLLNSVRSLTGVAGLDSSVLSGLLGAAQGALASAAPGTDTTALQNLIGTIGSLLGAGGTTPGGATTPGATTTRPATSVRTAATALKAYTPTASTRYRATITSVKVASNRRSTKVTLSCPSAAPKGCAVTLKGVLSGKKAFAGKQIVILRNARKTLTMKLTRSVASRLKRKGGSLKVSAATSFSTLAAVSKTVRVARKR